MAFALVYTGEHYVVDVLAGWIYCIAVYAAVEGSPCSPCRECCFERRSFVPESWVPRPMNGRDPRQRTEPLFERRPATAA